MYGLWRKNSFPLARQTKPCYLDFSEDKRNPIFKLEMFVPGKRTSATGKIALSERAADFSDTFVCWIVPKISRAVLTPCVFVDGYTQISVCIYIVHIIYVHLYISYVYESSCVTCYSFMYDKCRAINRKSGRVITVRF